MPVSGLALLTCLLISRPRPVSKVREMSKDLEVRWAEILRAKKQLGAVEVRKGFPAVVYWQVEDVASSGEKAQAEMNLAMWEYQILQRKALAAYQRVLALRRVYEVQKKVVEAKEKAGRRTARP